MDNNQPSFMLIHFAISSGETLWLRTIHTTVSQRATLSGRRVWWGSHWGAGAYTTFLIFFCQTLCLSERGSQIRITWTQPYLVCGEHSLPFGSASWHPILTPPCSWNKMVMITPSRILDQPCLCREQKVTFSETMKFRVSKKHWNLDDVLYNFSIVLKFRMYTW